MRAPAAGHVTKAFGLQPDGSFHYGTDRGWGSGREVLVMLAGEVMSVAILRDYGKTVRVYHGRDTLNRTIETRYCHLSRQDVQKGDTVSGGQQVGVMGSTGSLTKQVHLHSELWVNGVRVNETTFPFTMPSQAKDDTMPEYIYTAESGVGYALIDSNYTDGVIVTADPAVATQFSYLTIGTPTGGAGRSCTRAVFNATCAAATALWRAHASVGSGGGYNPADADVVDEGELGQALTSTAALVINDLTPKIAAIGVKIDNLTLTVQ